MSENSYENLMRATRKASARVDGAQRLERRRQAMRFRPGALYKRAKSLSPSARSKVLNDFQRIRRDVINYSGFKDARTGMRAIVRAEKAKVRREGVVNPIEIGRRYAEIERIARVAVAIAGIQIFNAA